ncbi:amidohydrolase family protein [Cellulosilyticum sp. I15G10I2]|uniref:amidohydrolase family protein n=1 Tax=Cellulosilyticum sp. I15G10I2 TaxID=1892843 RepID=UPI00085BB260|nr:amidohydrolase family protein [Cellulosilyticum sp. I15G10I2]
MTSNKSFILKGDIIYSKNPCEIITHQNAYLVCVNGEVEGIYPTIPKHFLQLPLSIHEGCLIIPGLVDLHLHAPQYAFRALSMHLQLIDWLDQVAFPEEAKYSQLDYAKESYEIFAKDLKKSATTRACIFATLHKESTILLMDLLEQTGLKCMVGKVNMDRNSSPYLQESTAESITNTFEWINFVKDRYQNTSPIITPRFLPSCTDTLMKELGKMCREFQLPLQSHLSENKREIAWVKSLCPTAKNYSDAYLQLGAFGGETSTIMAHCVHLSEEEIALIKQRNVYIAHCPSSNTNILSGIAPTKRYMNAGLNMGIGSDIGGGDNLSIFRTITEAIKVSKLHTCLIDPATPPITSIEAFYLATKGGGSFYGKVGSFEKGYEFDALIIDERRWKHPRGYSLIERLERVIYASEDSDIVAKYCAGTQIILE